MNYKPSNTNLTTDKHFRDVNVRTYLHDILPDDVKNFLASSNLKSGYPNLDAITNLYPALYTIGAISSLGKTTFIHQMADQLAEAGHEVIYFSLEQGVFELVSKSLARIMFKQNPSERLTSLQIRKTESNPQLTSAIAEYDRYAGNITIVECPFAATVEFIESYVTEYINSHHVKPVVMIDYLQIIQPSDTHLTTKDSIDSIVHQLKQFQSDNQLVMIVISSLNRAGYLQQVDFESFKESGGIEYTADVVWGLQLSVLHDEIFNSQSRLAEKRQKVKEAKAALPRRVELVCLKNRFGVSSYSCEFNYYSAYDYFESDISGLSSEFLNPDTPTDPDGFISVPDWLDIPFN